MKLTNRNSTVGSTKVDVALGDGRHSDLIKGSCEECGKCTGKGNSTVTSGGANSYTHLQQQNII